MVNKVTLIGNLGKDPEIRRLENGIAVAKFTLATNENYKDKSGEWVKQTEWHTIIAWRHLAERAEQQLKMGKLVYVEGKLTHRKWQDQDGNTKYTTEVVANMLRLLEKREGGGSGYTSNFPGADQAPPAKSYETNNTPVSTTPTSTAPTTTASTTTAAQPAAEPAAEPVDDDLPF